jgi:TatD DNase family protein
MVVIGEALDSSRAGVALAATDARLWAAVGIHPHEAHTATPDTYAALAALAREPRVVAIGEIGLDFHYDRSPRPVQAEVFRRQLELAAALNLPVSIHSRSAEAETLAILGDWSATRRAAGSREPLGVMHCFGYGPAAAARFVELGFFISLPGTVTFPKAEAVQAVARTVPDGMLVLETDAPVLAPQGHRGRRNEPAYLPETAATVAALRGVTAPVLAALTAANARRLFRLAASPAGTPVGSLTA